MAMQTASFFPERINMHVPSMTFAADLSPGQPYMVEFGAPIALDADGILAAQSIASATSTTTFDAVYVALGELPGPFGVNVTVIASGAATSTVTVTGYDYLNQVMVETLTLNGANTVQGVKAFKRITNVAWGATGGTTINLGWGKKLGLPYKATALIASLEAGVTATAGTLTTGTITATTQTATTNDPRGLFAPNGTLNGTLTIACAVLCDTTNLHGNAHFDG